MKCRITAKRLLIFLLSLALQISKVDAADLFPRIDGDTVSAVNGSGNLLWSRRVPLTQPLYASRNSDGSFLINGSLRLEANGRLSNRSADHDDSAVATAYQWTLPTLVNDDPSAFSSPQVVDKSGNAWSIIQDSVTGKAHVMKYVQKKGTWKDMKTLSAVYGTGKLDVDALGNVTVVALSGAQATGYRMTAYRYEPDVGWSSESSIFSETWYAGGMLNYGIVGDKKGDAIVAAGEGKMGAITVVYSYADRAWRMWNPISLPANYAGDMVNGISLARSPNGKYVELTYLAVVSSSGSDDLEFGYYSHKFDTASQAFGSPKVLPGTVGMVGQVTTAVGDNNLDRVKMVVDNNGEVSVVWAASPYLRPKTKLGTYASRKEGGNWQSPVHLSSTRYSVQTDTSSIAVDELGRVAFCTTFLPATDTQTFDVLKYIPEAGWSEDIVVSWAGTLTTNSRISWFGDGQLVGVYLISADESSGYEALSSSVFDGNSWGTSFPVPPDKLTSFSQSVSSLPGAAALLLFNPATSSSPTSYVNSSVLVTQ